MELKTIHCFLVQPAKGEDPQPSIGGAIVPKRGKLFLMLKGIFDKAEQECRIDIGFNHNAAGQQQNDCRDLIIAYIGNHKVPAGRSIALRLQSVTTQKSGLGLFFLMTGNEGQRSKLVLSRFPADQGILAEQKKNSLSVEFLEKVFMKSATAYKSAVYEGRITSGDFWIGRAVDKQINLPGDHVANYWIRHFLASDFTTTPAAGTKRLAVALRSAMNSGDDAHVKTQLAAAVTLATSVGGTVTSITDFCSHFGFSPETFEAIRNAVKHDNLMVENFQFDHAEFARHIAFRSVELSNGGILTADASKFNAVFRRESLNDAEQRVRFTTEGQVIDQRLRKVKV